MVDTLKEAMLQYAPQLEKDYNDYVRTTFREMVEDIGPDLKGVYNSRRWARMFRNSIRPNVCSDSPFGSFHNASSYRIDDAALARNAKRYGADTSLAWYSKMKSKLCDLENVTVSDPRMGSQVTVSGTHGDNKVEVFQHAIINVSPLGTLFHQFPARIYVNNKFQSEAQYKKTVQGWGIPVPEKKKMSMQYRCVKCGYTNSIDAFMGALQSSNPVLSCPSCRSVDVHREAIEEKVQKKPPIDPNSRPKQFKFAYKADYWPMMGVTADQNTSNLGVQRSDSIRGMTEQEAIDKLTKREVGPSGVKFFSRIYDIQCTAIRTWNDQKVWDASSGDPKPDEGVIKDVDVWGTKNKASKVEQATRRYPRRRNALPPGMSSMR
jgi:hypothetical protein